MKVKAILSQIDYTAFVILNIQKDIKQQLYDYLSITRFP